MLEPFSDYVRPELKKDKERLEEIRRLEIEHKEQVRKRDVEEWSYLDSVANRLYKSVKREEPKPTAEQIKREKQIAYMTEWRKNNKEYTLKYGIEYYWKNRDKLLLNLRNKRAIIRQQNELNKTKQLESSPKDAGTYGQLPLE